MPLPAVTRALCTVVLLLPCTGIFAASSADLITYPKDPNQYRSLRLPNNIDVLLVHDEGATHAAANLSVQAGSAQNPSDLPGLAHLTEHLVFLGSERYPDPNGYSTFIGKVGGSFNATTGADVTSYFFRVPGVALEEAMQRLSATLATPLFNIDFVDRERHAVDAEFRMRLDDDNFRLSEVLGVTYNPAHPKGRFSVGNIDTLSGDPQVLRQRVIDFYQRYYSANLMKLVVSGPQSLDQLQGYVDDSFAAIADRQRPTPVIDESLLRPGVLPAELQVKTLKPSNQVAFMFVLDNVPSDLSNHSSRFLFKLLNDKSAGGLQERLKQVGLARSVSAGLADWRTNESLLSINVTVPHGQTPDFARLQASVFAYLDLIRQQGMQRWRYEETATLVQQDFSQKKPGEPLRYVNQIAGNARLYPAQDWVYGPYRMEHFDDARLTELLDAITPDKLLRVWLTPDAASEQTSKWFAVPYRVQHITKWPVAAPVDGLALPDRNPFIADDMRVLDVNAPVPSLAVDNQGLKVWYRPEHQFDTPKAVWRLALKNAAAPSAVEQARRLLLTTWLAERLSPSVQQARQAGMDLSLTVTENGVHVALSGMRQHQPMLLRELLDAVANRPVEPAEFQRAAARLKDGVLAENGKPPMEAVNDALTVAINPGIWLPTERLAALNEVTLSGLESWRAAWLKQLNVEALAVGNLAPNDVQQMADMLTEYLHPTVVETAIPPYTLRTLAADLPVLRQQTTSKDHNMLMYAPNPERTLEARADSLLLAQLIKTRYYQSLRTQQQLGYVVNASAGWNAGQSWLAFLVQSHNYSSDVLRERTQAYLQEMDALLDGLKAADLALAGKAVASALQAREENAYAMSQRYWTDLYMRDYTFSTKARLEKLLTERTLQQVKATWRQHRNGPALWIVADPDTSATLADFQRTPTTLLAPLPMSRGDKVTEGAVLKPSAPATTK